MKKIHLRLAWLLSLKAFQGPDVNEFAPLIYGDYVIIIHKAFFIFF